MSNWKENMGLADDTAVVKIYTKSHIKEEWEQEADHHDRSLSKHLYVIIQEARWLQKQGKLDFSELPEQKTGENLREDEAFRELEEEVSELTSMVRELTEEEESEDQPSETLDSEWVQDVVDEEGQELAELLELLLGHSEFRSWLKQELEQTLYELGAENVVVYRPGNGWKLKGED